MASLSFTDVAVSARGMLGGLADRTVPVVVTGLTAALVLGGWVAGLPPLILVGFATIPLIIVFGYRVSLVALGVLLVVRALIDGAGGATATAGIAAAVIGLSVLVLVRSPSWPARVLVIAIALFASAAGGAAIYGAAETYGEAVRVLSLVAVAVITINAPGTLTLGRITGLVQGVGTLPALYALVQLATGTGTYSEGVLRSTGTLAQANSAAVLFALCNIVTFSRLLSGTGKRWVNLGFLALFLVAQLSTASIGGFATVVAMVLVYMVVEAGRRFHRIALGLLALALAVVMALNSKAGAERLTEYTSGGSVDDTSLGWRFQAWEKVLIVWRERPVLGNGLGATTSGIILHTIPHNEYVRLLAEVGLVGFTATVLLVVWFAVATIRRLRAGAPRAVCALALAVLAGAVVNGLAANTILYTVSFMTTVFILSGCWRIIRDGPPPDPVPEASTTLQEVRP
ncbi:MAG: O-antigen ligase family protein [Cellulomonas sp.]